MPNFVLIGHTAAEICPFFFQDGGSPPSWI